jgi:hypothetical protein
MKTIQSKQCPQCGGDFWTADARDNVKRCNNCRHEERYFPKSARDGNVHGTTRSQERKLKAMRSFAERHATDGGYELNVNHLDFGPAAVTLNVNPDRRTRLHIHAFLTRRGKVELTACSYYWGTSDAMASMFCRATNGHDERT